MVIGLLGGIGSGKSTVASLFVEAGAESVDADRLAHQVLEEPEARARVAARFGSAVLGPDGRVDRRLLAKRVFGDERALQDLNAIVHPPVRERIQERIRRHRALGPQGPHLVLDVPLLAESPLRAECDVLVFVDADAGARRERLRVRGWTEGELERREAHQTPLETKRALARFVVNNSGTLESTRREVERVLKDIRGLGPAASRGGVGID